jgi:hypothetical protein
MTPSNDQIKIPMNLHNTYRLVKSGEADKEQNVNPGVHPFLEPLIVKLTERNPTWEFINTQRRVTFPGRESAGVNLNYSSFSIYDGDEMLGALEKEYRHHGDSYVFTNHRVVKDRMSGRPVATKDIKKAFKLICKDFYAKTTLEHIGDAIRTARSLMSSRMLSAEHNFGRQYHKIHKQVQDYVVANLETLAEHIPQINTEACGMVIANKQVLDEVCVLNAAMRGSNGAIVAVRGRDYIVNYMWEGDGVSHTYTTDQLPAALKQGVGMLKLVEPNQHIEGVGLRVESGVYFVMLERPTNG